MTRGISKKKLYDGQAVEVEIDGVVIRYHTKTKRVYWSNHWEKIYKLVDAGWLKTVFYGPALWGHTEFVVVF